MLTLILQSLRSRARSGCNSVVLFMTDGEDESWDPIDDLAWVTAKRDELGCNTIMTYALGDAVGAQYRDYLKDIACHNDGIFYEIADNNADKSLADAMSGYFDYFAAGTAYHEDIRYVLYDDFNTGTELLSGCKSAFDRTVSPPALIGVTCMDVNVVADLPSLKEQPSWADFAQKFTDETASCIPVRFSPVELEEVRRRASGDGAVCNNLESDTTVTERTCALNR